MRRIDRQFEYIYKYADMEMRQWLRFITGLILILQHNINVKL